jgi:transcriptional regulator with XRE-family HTH domain
LGGRLQAVREVHKETQVDVARLCDISRAAVSQWETNTTEPSAKHLRTLADRYGLSYEWLAFGDGTVPAILTGQGSRDEVAAGAKIAELGRDQHWQLPVAVIGSLLQTRPDGLVVWQSASDSRPLIRRHDYVFIDRARTLEPDGVWLVDLPNYGPTLLQARANMTRSQRAVINLVSDDDRISIRPSSQHRIIGKVLAIFRAV